MASPTFWYPTESLLIENEALPWHIGPKSTLGGEVSWSTTSSITKLSVGYHQKVHKIIFYLCILFIVSQPLFKANLSG